MIDSAKKFATHRHTVKRYDSDEENAIDFIPGKQSIPILDAGAALQMAKDIVEAKRATLIYYYPSIFSNTCNVHIKSPTETLNVENFSLSIKAKKSDGTSDNLSTYASIGSILDDNSKELAFNTATIYGEYEILGLVNYTGYTSIEVNETIPHELIVTDVVISDKVSNTEIIGSKVTIEYLGLLDYNKHSYEYRVLENTNSVKIYTERTRWYKIHVEKTGYKTYSEEFRILSDEIEDMVIKLVPSDANITGALHGIISDENTSLSNATVTIFSDTSSYIVRTGITGIYRIDDIPILDSAGEYIWYDINVSRKGYISALKRGIGLSDGKSSMESITLKKDPNYTNIPPVANAGADQSIQVGESITLSGELSSDVETGTAYLQYKWSGATIATSYEQNVTLANLSEGTHHIVLQVTDEEGAVSTDTVTVTVAEAGTITHNGTTYGTVTSPYTGKVWLDRNLGASQVCTSSTDTACYGDYYQWGRNYDGHQNPTSDSTATRATDINNVGHGKFIYLYSYYVYDWVYDYIDDNASRRSSNWSKTDGTSICPVGFRVPNSTEIKAELIDLGSAQVQNENDAFNSFLRLPAAGIRDSRASYPRFYDKGDCIYLWTTSVSYVPFTYRVAGFDTFFHDPGVIGYSADRNAGRSIRCLKD